MLTAPSRSASSSSSVLPGLLGVLLALVAVGLTATRIVGGVEPVEIDIARDGAGWAVTPEGAASVTPSKKPNALDIAYTAPYAQGEELFMELRIAGRDGLTYLPSVPIQAGRNVVTVEPAEGFLSVTMRNWVFRWERPRFVVLRGGPSRPPDPPPVELAGIALGAAGILAALSLAIAPGRAVLAIGVTLALLSGGVAAANEVTPLRVFIAGETAALAALLAGLAVLVTRRRGPGS